MVLFHWSAKLRLLNSALNLCNIINPNPLPARWQLEWRISFCDRCHWFVAFDLALGNELVFLSADFLQQFAGRFVLRVLGDEQTAHGELQDGLFQRVHGLGAVEQQVEVAGHSLPVLGQLGGGVAVGQRAEQGGNKLGVLRGFKLALGLQRVTQPHEFIDAVDDAGLFGEGWKSELQ